MTAIHSFIHSGYFYSASSGPLLLRGAPDYSFDTVSELINTRTVSEGLAHCIYLSVPLHVYVCPSLCISMQPPTQPSASLSIIQSLCSIFCLSARPYLFCQSFCHCPYFSLCVRLSVLQTICPSSSIGPFTVLCQFPRRTFAERFGENLKTTTEDGVIGWSFFQPSTTIARNISIDESIRHRIYDRSIDPPNASSKQLFATLTQGLTIHGQFNSSIQPPSLWPYNPSTLQPSPIDWLSRPIAHHDLTHNAPTIT